MASAEPAVLGDRKTTLEREDLDRLIQALAERRYSVIGPVVRDGAIVCGPIAGTADLPVGWRDEQDAGSYRLVRGDGATLFDFTVGPDSWKRLLHPPRVRLWRAERKGKELEFVAGAEPAPRYAFFGVRPCELRAIAIQDRVLLGGPYADPTYGERREPVFVVVAQCGRAGRTCFCASMGTGPRAESGFDLALTEIEGDRPRYVAVAGSPRGTELLSALPRRPAAPADLAAADRAHARAVEQMGRSMDTRGVAGLLAQAHDHPRWEEVATRCLACGNCTQVCPTCFCTGVEDHLDLGGAGAERVRRWDSCFTLDYSYIHGGSVRPSVRARYRQWLTHKLSSWHDQFGSSGCVGCGRCITWCPVGIDLTEEVAALRKGGSKKERHGGNA